jgi:hypothetical protein
MQGASAGSLLARHVRSRLESELEDVRTQQQMLELEGSSGASSLEGNAQDRVLARLTKKRRELTELETRLRRKIEHQVKVGDGDSYLVRNVGESSVSAPADERVSHAHRTRRRSCPSLLGTPSTSAPSTRSIPSHPPLLPCTLLPSLRREYPWYCPW